MKPLTYIVLSASFVLSASAQTASVPTLGWAMFAGGNTARAILGIPGASSLGPEVRLPDDLQNASLNPAAGIVFAVAGDARTPLILDLNSQTRTPLDQAPPSPDAAVWSPSGSALALLYRGEGHVRIFTTQAGSWQLASDLAFAAGALAVSDDGSAVLALSDSGLSLYKDGNTAVLTPDPSASFAFPARGNDPAFWSAGQLTIGSQTVPFPADDGERVYLASPGAGRMVAVRSASGSVTLFDSSGQVTGSATCNCAVSGFDFSGRAATLRLLSADDGPLWLTDTSAGARAFFVPVGDSQQ